MIDQKTYILADADEILSPALVYYEDIIRENTRRVIDMAGGADRLWPHVKSHKIREMIRMQMEMGIRRFKCATLVEAEMAANCGASHVVLAYPLIGPAVPRFLALLPAYPGTHFYAIVDSETGLEQLSDAAIQADARVDALIDVNLGMDRTGVSLSRLRAFCQTCADTPGVRFAGLHCYDGHVHESDPRERSQVVSDEMTRVCEAMRGMDIPLLIAGGSPSFPCHARENGEYLSPGTVFLWDYGYASNFPDLPLTPAAAVLARVVSRPTPDTFTLDVGYKAIASDPAGQRGVIVGMEDTAEPLFQSEEHWVWRAKNPPAIGDVLYVVPTHICPTTALYDRVYVARNGATTGTWRVAARDRA